ncbi:MAG: hypothetical protein ABEL51_03355 [Salinibacter sp.]
MSRFQLTGAILLGIGWLVVSGLLLFSSNWSSTATEDWFPFSIDWSSEETAFVQPWLDAPAGKHGFVGVGSDGNFQFQDGRPVRFWGMALGPWFGIPDEETAQTVAAQLARQGINLVRIWGLDRMLFEPSADDTRHLSEARLARFDYFVKELKDHGIYLDLVLTFSREFRRDDGVIDWDAKQYTQNYEGQRLLQSMAFVDPYLFMLQKEYARQLLGHRNPYTGNRYAEEPAVAMIEIINETSLTYDWIRDYLNTDSPASPHITSYYDDLLDAQWNMWLTDRYEDRAALREAWLPRTSTRQGLLQDENPSEGTVQRILYSNRDKYSRARAMDLLRFYSKLEHDYFTGFYNHLKQELGVRMPVSGTHQFHGMANQLAQAHMDFAGGHAQWQHPIFREGQAWNEPPIRLINTPMVKGRAANIPYKADWIETRNTLYRLGYGMAIGGKPFVVSEYNHAFPNEYQAEFPLLLSAYSSFQAWDGAITHQYAIRPEELERSRIRDVFNVHNNPVLMSQMPIASLLMRRGDVRPADKRVPINYTKEQAYKHFLECGLDIYCVLERRDIPPETLLRHGISNQFPATQTDSVSAAPDARAGSSPYDSDTGQLSWNVEDGLVRIDTDTVQAAIGFVGDRVVQLEHLTIEAQTDFAAIAVVSLDGQPIPASDKLMITATSRVKNAEMETQRDVAGFYLLTDWGDSPVMVQDVQARLVLDRRSSEVLKAFALDEQGRLNEELDGTVLDGERLSLQLGNQQTLWYGLCAESALEVNPTVCDKPTRRSPR